MAERSTIYHKKDALYSKDFLSFYFFIIKKHMQYPE